MKPFSFELLSFTIVIVFTLAILIGIINPKAISELGQSYPKVRKKIYLISGVAILLASISGAWIK